LKYLIVRASKTGDARYYLYIITNKLLDYYFLSIFSSIVFNLNHDKFMTALKKDACFNINKEELSYEIARETVVINTPRGWRTAVVILIIKNKIIIKFNIKNLKTSK
jgi:hypothetical protein